MMSQNAKNLYLRLSEFNQHIHTVIEKLDDELKSATDIKDTTDIAFAVHQAKKWADDINKSLGRLEQVAKKIVCLQWVTMVDINSSSVEDKVRTVYCTAAPEPSTVPRIPKRDTDEYRQLIEYIKQHDDGEILRPHWPSLVEFVANQSAEGKPLPPGCDVHATYPVYNVRFWKRKGILEEATQV